MMTLHSYVNFKEEEIEYIFIYPRLSIKNHFVYTVLFVFHASCLNKLFGLDDYFVSRAH